ncbi:MAG: hypothetical protein LBU87_00915 [Lactobacillales bacterium]|jgi:HEAT repeat protein|nr:hypothetical protein [Lactobacillales bacterium]
MTLLKSFSSRVSALPYSQIGLLFTLALCAFLQTFALVCLDISGSVLFFQSNGIFRIGFDFLIVAAILAVLGYYQIVAMRRRGYGSFWICFLSYTLLLGLLYAQFELKYNIPDVLFVFKYAAWVLFPISLWSVASRVVPLRLDSLKFVLLSCGYVLGMAAAGWAFMFFYLSVETAFAIAAICLGAFVVIFKIMTSFLAIPTETFIRRLGASTESGGQKLFYSILSFAFLCFASKAIMDYVFYASLWQIPFPRWFEFGLSLYWALFGTASFLMLFFLYRTRYIYITLSGLIVFCLSLPLAAYGVYAGHIIVVLAANLIFGLTLYFYVTEYLHFLPLALVIGDAKQIQTNRYVIAQPVGFLLGGILIFCFSSLRAHEAILLCLSGFLLLFLFFSSRFYSNMLMHAFKMRLWRGGPLFLFYPKIRNYVMEQLKDKKIEDVIYFLRILEVSKDPAYLKNLLKALRHESETVRVFVIEKLGKLPDAQDFEKTIERTFYKDESPAVQEKALSFLIPLSYRRSRQEGDKFIPYLDKRPFKRGAMIGFLSVGGDKALLAMDGLQKLSTSKKQTDNLIALDVIRAIPSPGLVRLLTPMLKNHDPVVAASALLAAGAMAHPALLPMVFDALEDLQLQESALKALKMYGKKAFPPIEKMIHNPLASAIKQKRLVLFLGYLNSGEAKQILIRALQIENQKLRKTIMKTLNEEGIFWVHADKRTLVFKGLEKDIDRINWSAAFVEKYAQAPTHESAEAFASLNNALLDDIYSSKEIILYQLSLLKTDRLYQKAIRILLREDMDKFPVALGMLQDLLPGKIYQQIRKIILFDPAMPRPENLSVVDEEEAAADINALIVAPPFVLAPWIKATAFYCLRKLNNKAGMPAVLEGLKENNPYVLEAAIWALARLAPDENELHRILLSVPTSHLVGQSLDQIIKS